LVNDPRDHLPQGEFAVARCPKRLLDPQTPCHVVDGPDRSEGQALFQYDCVLDGPQVLQLLLVAQRQPQRFDLRGGAMTDIGNRAVEDLAMGTIRLT
jgi:hypothetical protein